MSNLSTAKALLKGHTLVLVSDDRQLISDKRGISPIIDFIQSGTDLTGCSAADVVVGKAAALMFVKAGIKEVFAKTLSLSAKAVLDDNGIPHAYETLTERIINRDGTDTCPMEKALTDTSDPDEAYEILLATLERLTAPIGGDSSSLR